DWDCAPTEATASRTPRRAHEFLTTRSLVCTRKVTALAQPLSVARARVLVARREDGDAVERGAITMRVRLCGAALFAGVAVALSGCGGSGGGGGGGGFSSTAGVSSFSMNGPGGTAANVGSGSGTGSQPKGPYSGAPLAGSTNPIDVAALQGLQAAGVEPQ